VLGIEAKNSRVRAEKYSGPGVDCLKGFLPPHEAIGADRVRCRHRL
jgi:hypothetical protein